MSIPAIPSSPSEFVDSNSLDTSGLKKFAQAARTQLVSIVASKLDRVLADDSRARRESEKAVRQLENQIKDLSRDQVIEKVAYTWFNRFCALRFMDVNRYTKLGTLSPAEGFSQPEILADAKQGVIDDEWKVDKSKVMGLLDGSLPSEDPQEEAYQLLLVSVCNSNHKIMPFMFEKIADYTELLIPDDLLSDSSILTATREALTPESCQNVEVIGWLYQFYISEKKDEVINRRGVVAKDEIPAATQLFTPHWIVRYLVENSLGRLWMLNHPDSRLAEQMDYYIRPEEPAESSEEGDFLRISSPEEIKICDPACGSGHMLTYAFDLLYAIYEEQGYQATDIPRLILTHNLYGIEIDQRAGALAAFALTIKAREKYRRFLTGGKVVQPNICVLENIQIDPEDLSAYMDKVGRDLFSGGLQGVVNQWEEADNFGSLIRPLVTDVSEVLELLRERQMGEDLFLAGVHQKVLKALRQADYLSPKYHIVVANPPYMGKKAMNSPLKAFLKKSYLAGKTDVFASFIVRCTELASDGGFVGMVTPFVWMFLGSYEELRKQLLSESTIRTLVQLEYNAFEPACIPVCAFTVFINSELFVADNTKINGNYIRLTDFRGHQNQAPKTLEAIKNPECGWMYQANSDDFRDIPGQTLAYWMPAKVRHAFRKGQFLEEIAEPRQGMATTDNNRFLRSWYEVAFARIGFGYEDTSAAARSRKRWFPYNKGGSFRKWSGNQQFVVDYEQDGMRLKIEVKEKYREKEYAQGFSDEKWDRLIEVWVLKNQHSYFKPCLSWSKISSSNFSVRYYPPGFIFDVAGSSIFPNNLESIDALNALLNSSLVSTLLSALSPTLNFEAEHVCKIPVLKDLGNELSECLPIARELVRLSQEDWNNYEYAWGFEMNPLLTLQSNSDSLQQTYLNLREDLADVTEQVRSLEEANNKAVAKAYGLNHEIDLTPENKSISLICNPLFTYGSDKSESELEALLLADTMREFISYAVGCMLGRYSLDKPGLILANQGETADDYRQQIPEPTFAPDEDNVIPLLDGDWFTDDISERFKEFLKVTFGTEHYEENLAFLENSLFPANLEGKKRKTIRDYFLKEFYNHHIKLYKKRPIYWLFSSPKGTFNALIYMHRYRPDTVSVVLNDYLREFQTKLVSKAGHLQTVANSSDSSKADKAKAIKEINALNKQLKELEDYQRDVIYPLATKQIEIDLDDGVVVNYNKFGKALKKVTGLTGK